MLRISGKNFDAATFASKSTLPIVAVHIRGERRSLTNRNSPKHSASAVTIEVSRASFSDLKRQVKDATRFLEANRAEIRRVVRNGAVEDVTLDFGVDQRDVPAQFDYLPPSLVRIAGQLGIGIELSHYAVG